ncbi:hypothetical protein BDR07DRAFT_1450058 [Suillus spraguei]|nr:hypothetical protein BDR07DRAFT_1450058 [Suillus spraguei]
MITELKTVRKKRTTSEAKPTSDGDHRKRRRNRTTQSCLHCHTSKRMVLRPEASLWPLHAARSGLCVYEVDDPSQRTDVRDESLHLRQRVAELEGVIRELKNKPHPRWVQANSTPEVEFERCHSHSRSAAEQQRTGQQIKTKSTSSSSTSPLIISPLSTSPLSTSPLSISPLSTSPLSSSPLSTSSSSTACSISGPRDESYLSSRLPSPSHAHPTSTFPQSPTDLTNTSAPSFPYFSSTSTPLNTPSPPIMMLTDEYAQTRALVPGEQSLAGELDFLMSCSGSIGCDDSLGYNIINGHLDDTYRSDHCYDTSAHNYCGCLTEGSSYNVVLELSLRLRKAADILKRSAYHHLGSNNCALNQRIMELDGLATMTLGNITTPPDDINQICPQQHPLSHKFISPSSTLSTASGRTIPASTASPQTTQGISSWDITMSSVSNSSSVCEDSLMSWKPSRCG